MISPMETLPLEMINQVLALLSQQDHFTLRLSNRELRWKTLDFFGRTYFSQRRFMLCLRSSLDPLLAIARHPQLASYVRHLTIGMEFLEMGVKPWPSQVSYEDDWMYYQTEEARKCIAYESFWDEQKTIRANGEDRAILNEALKLLCSLETIVVAEPPMHPWKRDGNSYGWRDLERRTGVEIQTMCSRYQTPPNPSYVPPKGRVNLVSEIARRHTTAVVLSAVAEAKPKLKQFITDFPAYGPIDVSEFNLNETSSEGLGFAFAKLEKLTLWLSTRHQCRTSMPPAWTQPIHRFMDLASTIQELDLDFLQTSAIQAQECVELFRATSTVRFPRLKRLSLRRFAADTQDVIDLVETLHPTLTTFYLDRPVLFGRCWRLIAEELILNRKLKEVHLILALWANADRPEEDGKPWCKTYGLVVQHGRFEGIDLRDAINDPKVAPYCYCEGNRAWAKEVGMYE